jgi:hypothetical protein
MKHYNPHSSNGKRLIEPDRDIFQNPGLNFWHLFPVDHPQLLPHAFKFTPINKDNHHQNICDRWGNPKLIVQKNLILSIPSVHAHGLTGDTHHTTNPGGYEV